MTVTKQLRSATAMTALALGQTVATAQVVVTHSPDLAAVPTLSQWAMIVTAVLLALVTVVATRKRVGSKTIAVAALVSLGALGGFNGVRQAMANGYTTYSMTSASGGQVSVPSTLIFAYVLNGTSQPQRIISITPQYGPPEAIDDKPACVPGLVLAPNAACALRASGDS